VCCRHALLSGHRRPPGVRRFSQRRRAPRRLSGLLSLRGPPRKPTPPPPGGNPTAASGEEAYAATGPNPTESGAGSKPSAPSPDLTVRSIPPGRPGQPPSQAELIGLDQPEATRLFGPAAEKSDEPPATIWRYKTATCELDLFFYLDLRSGRMRTLHYSFKGEGTDAAGRQDCLRSLVASRGG